MTPNLDQLGREVRHAARSLRKSPLFTITAALALALGIGATTTLLSVVDAVLVRPLPYANADRLVVLLHEGRNPVAPANYTDWRRETRSFSAMAAAEYWSPDVTGGDNPEQVLGLRVTASTFPLLGVRPLLGRTFAADEEQAGGDQVVVLSHGLWQRRYGGDARVIGTTLPLNGRPFTIIGVMPPGFQFAPFWATKSELWAPLSLGARLSSRDGQSLRIFARIAPGVTLDRARADVRAVTARLERDHPGTNRDVTVVPLREKVVGSVRTPLLVLFAAVGFVLLIACANVAHMLLARGAARRREMSIRAALGATRRRLVLQMLLENALLSLLGGAAGVALATWGVKAVVARGPAIVPRVANVAIDGRVLAMALMLTAVTTILFGLGPAMSTARTDLASSFRGGGRGSTEEKGGLKWRAALIASEFALALVLLVSAGLMIRTFTAMEHVDPGFDPRNVVTMTISTTGTPAADSARHASFYSEALARVRSAPGVEAASFINHLPLAGDNWGTRFRPEGLAERRENLPRATYRVVFPGYFGTMRIPVRAGRDVSESDRSDAPPVAVINEFMAQRHWPGQSAVGKRITLDDSTFVTIVGVVKDVVREQWTAPAEEEIYFPFQQQPAYVKGVGASRYMTLVARGACREASCDVGPLASRVRDAVRAVEPRAPISAIASLPSIVDRATADTRFYVALLGAFASTALVLAALGIYGMMAYTVARRTQEIGIRIALGARPGAVVRSMVVHSLRMAGAGAFAGIAAALVLTRLMRSILYGVSASDAVTFAGVTAVLVAVAALASWIPARRAATIDPLRALRS